MKRKPDNINNKGKDGNSRDCNKLRIGCTAGQDSYLEKLLSEIKPRNGFNKDKALKKAQELKEPKPSQKAEGIVFEPSTEAIIDLALR